jgi:hypothetical protein
MYEAEPVHLERRLEVFQAHLRSEGGSDGDENWIVEFEGEPVAYAFLRVPWGRKRGSNVREILVQGESAGSRIALAGALPELMERLGLDELWMAAAWQDADLRQILRMAGICEDLTTMIGHTMRIVDLPGLMDDLSGYVRARLSSGQTRGLCFEQDGDRYLIVRGADHLALDGAGATRLVLGRPPSGKDGLPSVPSSLQWALSALFPLPSFLPGLDCR